ncbi:MAG: GNAT family acetyltransferase [Candidatus Nanopelagicales bacterium]|nr:GNAT family acetyltransferase [Candidatus Nanopelagicales bacterium]
MLIREFREADRGAVIAMWHRAGLVRPWNDPERDIDRKLADSPWGLLVGEVDGAVVASMMVGYDGHRGSVFYLAVDTGHRGRGHGTVLMAHAEALLLSRGCPKLNVSVRADNVDVIGFYEARGYRHEGSDHAVTLGRRLIEDGPQP